MFNDRWECITTQDNTVTTLDGRREETAKASTAATIRLITPKRFIYFSNSLFSAAHPRLQTGDVGAIFFLNFRVETVVGTKFFQQAARPLRLGANLIITTADNGGDDKEIHGSQFIAVPIQFPREKNAFERSAAAIGA